MNERNVSWWTEEEFSQYVIDLLRRRKLLKTYENIIYCPKVFIINSILRTCFKKSQTSPVEAKDEWVKYLQIIDNYIEGKVVIKWRKGKYEIYEQ